MKIGPRDSDERFEVTPADRLTLLRAVEAEGEPRERVARALVTLWVELRRRGDTRSLGGLVRAYAQPVNPRWMPGGDLHVMAVERAKNEVERRALQNKALRRQTVHAARSSFTEKTVSAVDKALGVGEHQELATDYAAHWVDAAKKGYVPLTDATPGRNRFWTRFRTALGYVVEATNEQKNGAGGEAGPGVALLAVVLAWALLRRV